MQDSAAYSKRISFWKSGFERNIVVYESHAAKRSRARVIEGNAQTAQRGHAIRHQSFATRLIDRRTRSIGKRDTESFAPRGDGRREASRSTANDE
jgi:hypothetical protein